LIHLQKIEFAMEIRESVKLAAKREGVSVGELAERMGITRAALFSRLKDPKYSTLVEIAGLLGVGVWELLPYDESSEEIDVGDVGIRVRVDRLLRSRGMTIASLSAKLGESPVMVSRWLCREYPPLDLLYAIARYFGVSVSWILGEAE